MLYLRPSTTTVTVTSETAEIVAVPAYKIFELVAGDDFLAARIFRRIALVIFHQMEKFMLFNEQKGYIKF